MPPPTKDISEHDEVIDVILHQRREKNQQMEGAAQGFPDHLLRR
jgi:DNA replication licensing factor MCM7